jgi:hypothetical protein
MLVQQMRVAEMEGNNSEKDRFKAEADTAKARFTELANAKRAKQEEEERLKAEKRRRQIKNKLFGRYFCERRYSITINIGYRLSFVQVNNFV